MTIYRSYQFDRPQVAKYVSIAYSLLGSLDIWNSLATQHFAERTSERNINLAKISQNRIKKGRVFEIKVEDDSILTVGVEVAYNKKSKLCLILGFKTETPAIVTAWLK